jgi:hypothetical protein
MAAEQLHALASRRPALRSVSRAASVSRDGQMSDKPKHEPPFMTISYRARWSRTGDASTLVDDRIPTQTPVAAVIRA